MASKQKSEFEKCQIIAYYDSRLLLRDIAKKLNRHHLSIDVFLKDYKGKNGTFGGVMVSNLV